ncbi:hypothetical protein [Lacisediminihabitans sp.]|jgi:hypothetical protein|uniref:hypothetical protein n=1 Tax=Lacisediminihabitans sp. TaxID=2787631 RepID=UPI002F93C9F8
MGAAVDALVTAQTVLEQNVLPMTAMYPIMRAAMENAALAIYLLAPSERDQRPRHTYLVADDDAQLRCTFSKPMGNIDAKVARTRARKEQLERQA